MYVPTMNAEELRAQYRADVEQLNGRIAHKSQAMYRAALKAKHPWTRFVDLDKTKRGNKYILRLYCRKRGDLTTKHGISVYYLGIMHTDKGNAIVDDMGALLGGRQITPDAIRPKPVKVYLPHVFDRYKERFGQQEENIIHQFFRRNEMQYVTAGRIEGKHGEYYDALAIINDGVLLGTCSEADLITFRTFLTTEQLNPKQREYVNRMAQLHLDMKDSYEKIKPTENMYIFAK